MNIQEKINRLGSNYTQKIQKPKESEEDQPQKQYSCLTEEEYDKAKYSLTEEEKKIVSDLHEQFKDYMQIYSIWNIAKKFSFDPKITKNHLDVQYKRYLENQEIEWKNQKARPQNTAVQSERDAKGHREQRNVNQRVHSNLRPKKNDSGENKQRRSNRTDLNNGLTSTNQKNEKQNKGDENTQRTNVRMRYLYEKVENGQKNQKGENDTDNTHQNNNLRNEQGKQRNNMNNKTNQRQNSKGENRNNSYKNIRKSQKKDQEFIYVRKTEAEKQPEQQIVCQNVVEVPKTTEQQTHDLTKNTSNSSHHKINEKQQQNNQTKKETTTLTNVDARKPETNKVNGTTHQTPLPTNNTQSAKVVEQQIGNTSNNENKNEINKNVPEPSNKDLVVSAQSKVVSDVAQPQTVTQSQPLIQYNVTNTTQTNKTTATPSINNTNQKTSKNHVNTSTSTKAPTTTKNISTVSQENQPTQQQKSNVINSEIPKVPLGEQTNQNNHKKVTQNEKTQDNVKTTPLNEKAVTPKASQVTQRTEPTQQAQKTQKVEPQQKEDVKTEQALQQPQKFNQALPTHTNEQFNNQQQQQWQIPFYPPTQMMPMMQPNQLPQTPQVPGYYICFVPYPPQQPSQNGTSDANSVQQPPMMMPMQYPTMPMQNQFQGYPMMMYPPQLQTPTAFDKSMENNVAPQGFPMMPMYTMPTFYPQVPIQNNTITTNTNQN